MGEINNSWEREVVITEMTKGKELMCQLQKYLVPVKLDVCQYLAAGILSSQDKALSLLKGTALSGMMSKGKQSIDPPPSPSTAQLESYHLLADSRTKSCNRPSTSISTSRKRKKVEEWTLNVQARSGEEVPPEDGYSWSKYGQKPILGATYPREYYRCAHRSCRPLCVCLATKMVQRIETEPSVFKVIYRDQHSCGQESKNKNGELVVQTKETQSDEVGRLGEIPESGTPDVVSNPNNSFNNSSAGVVFSNSNSHLNMTNSEFISTPTSSPHPDGNFSLDATNFPGNGPENAGSAYETPSSYADYSSPLDDPSLTAFFSNGPENASSAYKGLHQNPYDAAVAYDAAAQKLYGVDTNLNFPHRYNKQA